MRYDHFSMLPERAFQKRATGGMTLEGGGSSQPTNQTITQTNIPEWLRPQTEALLGAATQEYFQTTPVTTTDPETGETKTSYNITGIKPFTPYSARPEDYVAGFSPLQQQVQYEAANMQRPGQFGAATNLAGMAGRGGLESAGMALGYGQQGYMSGQRGQQVGLTAAQEAAQRARMAEQAAYGYGQAGYQAGLQGQQSGLLGQQIGTQGGQRFGEMGAQSGMLGQQLGIAGGQQYGGMGAGYGAQAAGLAPQAQRYGQTAADIGAMGLRAEALGRDVGEEARMYARQAAGMGGQYNRMATDPYAVQAFMSPYQQAVINAQKEAAIRDFDIQSQNLKSQAVRSGAYGGARQAIQAAEAQRNLNAQLQNIEAMGRQTAYDKAIQSMQYGIGTGLQGLQGAQAGLGTALSGGQLGLSGIGQAMAGQQAGLAGLGQAGQLYGLGMQGAGMGLQGLQAQLAGTAQGMQGAGVGLSGIDRMLAGTGQGLQGAQAAMQGAGVGLSGLDRALASGQLSLAGTDRGLAGTAQGMQGAQVGLQGVSGAQAGYGLTGQMGKAMSDIGTAQQQADLARMNFQSQQGAAQQAQEQSIINQAIQNYAMAQQNPAQQLAAYNALLRGYATPTTTVSQYQAAPSMANQLVGLGAQGAAAYGLMGGGRKKGGAIKEKKYAEGGITDIDEKVINDPTAYSEEAIKRGIDTGSISKMAGAIGLSELKQAQDQANRQKALAAPAPQGTVLGDLQAGIAAAPSNLSMAGGGIVAFEKGGLNDPEEIRRRDQFYQSIGLGGYSPEYSGGEVANPSSIADYMAVAKKYLTQPRTKEEEEAEAAIRARPKELEKQREFDRYAALAKMGARIGQSRGPLAAALSAGTEAALPDLMSAERAYREGIAGVPRELGAVAGKRRAEEMEAAKAGLELYGKAEQRRASAPNLQKVADNYVVMRQKAGDKRDPEVIWDEGANKFLVNSMAPQLQQAAASGLRAEVDVDQLIAKERKDNQNIIALASIPDSKINDRNRKMVEDARRQVAEMDVRHQAMRQGLRYSGQTAAPSGKNQITVKGVTHTKPAHMTDDQWEQYKRYAAGAK